MEERTRERPRIATIVRSGEQPFPPERDSMNRSNLATKNTSVLSKA
jgi:hypothetical protein